MASENAVATDARIISTSIEAGAVSAYFGRMGQYIQRKRFDDAHLADEAASGLQNPAFAIQANSDRLGSLAKAPIAGCT